MKGHVHHSHAYMYISNWLPPPAHTLHFHSSGRYPYLRQRRSKCWGCGAVVRPISRTNGGLTALCALREEDQPPAAGRAERTGGQEGGGGSVDLRQAAAVGYSRPHLSGYYNMWIPLLPWSTFTPETGEGGREGIVCVHVWHVYDSYGYFISRLWVRDAEND